MASLLYYDDCTYLSPFLKARKILSTCSGCCPQTLPPTRPEEGILGDFPAMTFERRELRAEESLQSEMDSQDGEKRHALIYTIVQKFFLKDINTYIEQRQIQLMKTDSKDIYIALRHFYFK